MSLPPQENEVDISYFNEHPDILKHMCFRPYFVISAGKMMNDTFELKLIYKYHPEIIKGPMHLTFIRIIRLSSNEIHCGWRYAEYGPVSYEYLFNLISKYHTSFTSGARTSDISLMADVDYNIRNDECCILL